MPHTTPPHPRPDALPPPDADALAHSARLIERIHAEIAAAGGWLPFDRYMELALYCPGLGYYSGGARKFGAEGDFITAPGISPLFGQALAQQIAQVLALSAPQVLEVGAGTGQLAADLLAELERLGCPPQRYEILELSGELRERQAQTLAAEVPHLADRVSWRDTLPEHYSGCVVANELLDVLPVRLAHWSAGAILERGVRSDGADFAWDDRPATGALLAAARALPIPDEADYLSELGLAVRAWVREWSRRLACGALLLIDYGYPQAEFYSPGRASGTLLCYYRHRAHADPFRWPGLTDITAFVDFTAVAETAHAGGLEVLGYISQANFLLNCGLLEGLARRGPSDSADYLRAARAVQRLIGPHEMGELFKVIALGRGITAPLVGFSRGDRLHAL